jgi:hypothetical protein
MKLLEQIPKSEPDIKIGSLSLWISETEVIPQDGISDWVVFNTPTLLNTEDIIVFSSGSDTKLFEFRNLLSGFKEILNKVGSEDIVVDVPFEESEFGLKFICNLQGQIKIEILYRAWRNNGHLGFIDIIDQSYLPPIISKLESILKQY